MNSVNLGANTLGVQAASKKYFNKDVSELTLSEASVIEVSLRIHPATTLSHTLTKMPRDVKRC